jgi:hypothetical protein
MKRRFLAFDKANYRNPGYAANDGSEPRTELLPHHLGVGSPVSDLSLKAELRSQGRPADLKEFFLGEPRGGRLYPFPEKDCYPGPKGTFSRALAEASAERAIATNPQLRSQIFRNTP